MAKRKKACKNPVTAQKVGRGIKISVTVPTLAAAKKVVKRLGVRVENPTKGRRWFVVNKKQQMAQGPGMGFKVKSEADWFAGSNGLYRLGYKLVKAAGLAEALKR